MRLVMTVPTVLALLVGVGQAQDQSVLQKKADAIRATAGELNYKKIPWVTDLFEGFKLAKQEKRPVFLYLITGDPLDDC